MHTERQLLVEILDFLAEIEARSLATRRGFSGLFDYATSELGYSEGGAWRRINAMRLCRRVAGVRDKLITGALTLTAAAQVQAAFERRERERKKAAACRRREQRRSETEVPGSRAQGSGSPHLARCHREATSPAP